MQIYCNFAFYKPQEVSFMSKLQAKELWLASLRHGDVDMRRFTTPLRKNRFAKGEQRQIRHSEMHISKTETNNGQVE